MGFHMFFMPSSPALRPVELCQLLGLHCSPKSCAKRQWHKDLLDSWRGSIKIHVVLLNSNLLMSLSLLLVFGHFALHKPLCSARGTESLTPSTTLGMEKRGAVAEQGPQKVADSIRVNLHGLICLVTES